MGDLASNHSSDSSGTVKKQNKKQRQKHLVISDSEESDDSNHSCNEKDEPNQPLRRFLIGENVDFTLTELVCLEILFYSSLLVRGTFRPAAAE